MKAGIQYSSSLPTHYDCCPGVVRIKKEGISLNDLMFSKLSAAFKIYTSRAYRKAKYLGGCKATVSTFLCDNRSIDKSKPCNLV